MLLPSTDVHGRKELRPIPLGTVAAVRRDQSSRPPLRATDSDQGLCLYFVRPAAVQSTGDPKWVLLLTSTRYRPSAPWLTPKKIAAFLAALPMLWPELAKLIGALVRGLSLAVSSFVACAAS